MPYASLASPHLNWLYYYADQYDLATLGTLYTRLLDSGEARGGLGVQPGANTVANVV